MMVAEDYDDTRLMMRVILEQRGFRVVEASNGLEAVGVAMRERPDLILMDMDMPVLDGCAATRRIRQEEELRKVPIVAFSAHLRDEWQARATSAGFTDYVGKPVDLDHLKGVLGRYLAGP